MMYSLSRGRAFITWDDYPKILQDYDGVIVDGEKLYLEGENEVSLFKYDPSSLTPETLKHVNKILMYGPLMLFKQGEWYTHEVGGTKHCDCLCTFVSSECVKMKEQGGEEFKIVKWSNFHVTEKENYNGIVKQEYKSRYIDDRERKTAYIQNLSMS